MRDAGGISRSIWNTYGRIHHNLNIQHVYRVLLTMLLLCRQLVGIQTMISHMSYHVIIYFKYISIWRDLFKPRFRFHIDTNRTGAWHQEYLIPPRVTRIRCPHHHRDPNQPLHSILRHRGVLTVHCPGVHASAAYHPQRPVLSSRHPLPPAPSHPPSSTVRPRSFHTPTHLNRSSPLLSTVLYSSYTRHASRPQYRTSRTRRIQTPPP